MTEHKPNLDRMVDGELDRNAERELLLDCESNNRWRELALAFVESQALQLETKILMSSPHMRTHGTDDADVDRVNDAKRATEAKPDSSVELVPKKNVSWDVWSLAAAILLSLGLGYGLGWGWQRTSSGENDFVVDHPHQQVGQESKLPSSMQFMVNHPETRELQQVEIPLLKATDLGPNWQQRLQADSWDKIVDEMRRQGLNLRQQRTLTPVRLSNGQRVVVPVDYFFEEPYQ